jgi:hypothetical protein
LSGSNGTGCELPSPRARHALPLLPPPALAPDLTL